MRIISDHLKQLRLKLSQISRLSYPAFQNFIGIKTSLQGEDQAQIGSNCSIFYQS
jgi:hypothetical protein